MFTQPFIHAQIKENIKTPRQWPLCGEFNAQMASNAENVSIWWRHHASNQWPLSLICVNSQPLGHTISKCFFTNEIAANNYIFGNPQKNVITISILICRYILSLSFIGYNMIHESTALRAAICYPLRLVSDYPGSHDCLQAIDFYICCSKPEIRPRKSKFKRTLQHFCRIWARHRYFRTIGGFHLGGKGTKYLDEFWTLF